MQLAQNAVHGAMAGYTAFSAGVVNNRTVSDEEEHTKSGRGLSRFWLPDARSVAREISNPLLPAALLYIRGYLCIAMIPLLSGGF